MAWAGGYAADRQRAIDVVAAHPAFAPVLAGNPGWTASAYDGRTRYGLWRVDLAAADGRPLGWAQVQLDSARVVGWETPKVELQGAAYEAARDRLLDVLRDDAGFRALAGDPDDHDWNWVGYEDWRDTWVVHLERGPDSLYVILRSAHAWTRSLEDLQVIQIHATQLPEFDEWRDRHGAEAVARAFGEPAVAAAVRGVAGWTAAPEPIDRGVWIVRFLDGERVLVTAEVDVDRGVVVVSR